MSIFNMKDKIKKWKEKQEERARFRELVEQETLPLKRAGYLAQRKLQAAKEGKEIALKELEKKKSPERSEFGLNTKPQDQFTPTHDWGTGLTKPIKSKRRKTE